DDSGVEMKAVREGAQDYLVKGQTSSTLMVRTIRYAIERRRTQDAIWELEEQYKMVLKQSSEAILQVDQNGQILTTNGAAATIFGYSLEELRGRALDSIIPNALWQMHRHSLQRYASPQ